MDTFIAAFSGMSLSALLARWGIHRALSEFERMIEKIQHINEVLAAILVKLEKLAEHDTLLKEHSQKIAYFEGICADFSRSKKSIS